MACQPLASQPRDAESAVRIGLDARPVLLDRFCRRMVTGTSMGTASHQDADLLVSQSLMAMAADAFGD